MIIKQNSIVKCN